MLGRTRFRPLTDVHRFTDPTYAALTLRLRNTATREEALSVAVDLEAGGHVTRVDSPDQACRTMVDAWLGAHQGCGQPWWSAATRKRTR